MSTVQKLWQNQNFGSLTSIFGYNFTQNLRNIRFRRRNDCPIFQNYFFGTFWRNLRKILGTDFPQSPKNCQKWPKMAFFRINKRFSRKRAKISKKRPCYVSDIFYHHFMPGFGKILGAVSEIMRYGRTYGRTHGRTGLIFRSLSVYNRGPIKCKWKFMLLVPKGGPTYALILLKFSSSISGLRNIWSLVQISLII